MLHVWGDKALGLVYFCKTVDFRPRRTEMLISNSQNGECQFTVSYL